MTKQQNPFDAKTSRREFILCSTASMAGLAALGRRGASAETFTGLMIGSGGHTYEVVHDWLTPPPDIRFGDTQGLAQDSQGRIYVSHTVHPDSQKKHAIAVFDRNGRFITSWGERFAGGGHGLDLRKEGGREYLYHCDTAHRQVVKTTLDGTVVWEMGAPAEAGVYFTGSKEQPFIPTNVAFSPNGDFYVTDGYGSDWIHQFDVRCNYIRTFGGKGREPGKVLNAHGIWLDDRGKEPFLVVADRANSRMQYFTLDGKHVKFATEGMRQPCHFHIRHDEMLVPDLRSVLTIVDRDNRVVVQLGDGAPSNLRCHPRQDFIPGKFIHPHAAKFLHNGDILVVEWVPIGRVTLLRHVLG
jgi:DNA-binding beta-propeller fold protein YncE